MSSKIENSENTICSYGCGNRAFYIMSAKGGEEKFCCSKHYTQCPNQKSRTSRFFKGRKLSQEHKDKIGKIHKGKILSEDQKDKIRKYKINSFYFRNIDDCYKSYVLGFILADGCIGETNLSISLQEKDRDILEKILFCLKSNHKIFPIKNKGKIYSRINIHNKTIVSDLIKHGVGRRKSFTTKPLNCIPEKFERDFWRGVIDGDGSIYLEKRQGKKSSQLIPTIQICGTKEICEGFKEFCLKYIDTKANVRPMKSIYAFKINGNKARVISSALYGNSKIYLNRKFINYVKLSEEVACAGGKCEI